MKHIPNILPADWMEHWDSTPDTLLNNLIANHFYYTGDLNALNTFCKEKSINYKTNSLLIFRNNLRNQILIGQINAARQLLIDFDIELIEQNKEINFYLLCQQGLEMVGQSDDLEVLEYLSNEVAILPENEDTLKDVLEYVIFQTGDTVSKRRFRLASYVNRVIMDKYEKTPDELKDILVQIMDGESELQKKCKFPTFKDYLNEN